MSLTSVLALNRTVSVVLVAVLFFGLGEQLWNPFFPAYLQAKLGGGAAMAGVSIAALIAVGVYACLRNLFEAVCYVGGGQLTARLGAKDVSLLITVATVEHRDGINQILKLRVTIGQRIQTPSHRRSLGTSEIVTGTRQILKFTLTFSIDGCIENDRPVM